MGTDSNAPKGPLNDFMGAVSGFVKTAVDKGLIEAAKEHPAVALGGAGVAILGLTVLWNFLGTLGKTGLSLGMLGALTPLIISQIPQEYKADAEQFFNKLKGAGESLEPTQG